MKSKPKVIIDCFHLLQAQTGIRTYTLQIIDALAESSQRDVEYVVVPPINKISRISWLRGRVNMLKKILNHLFYFFWKQLILPFYILYFRGAIVVSFDYLLPLLKFGRKSVTVFHDTFYWEIQGAYNPVWQWYFLRSVKGGLNKKTSIIVTSNYIQKKVRDLVTDNHELNVVYQSPKKLAYKDEGIWEFLNLNHGENYVLHVGIFERRKNLEVLIRAFNELRSDSFFKRFKLVLAGAPGVSILHNDFNRLTELIKDLGLVDDVILPGFVPNEILGSLYKNAFVYVFPSKEEGFGIPILEAMNAEIPVIISDQPALVEIAGDSAMIFEKNSSDDLYRKLLSLKDIQTREKFIRKGSSRARQFSREIFFDGFHRVISKKLKS